MTAVLVAFSSELTHGSALSRLVRVAVLGSGLRTWIILGLLSALVLAFLWSLGGCLPWFLLVGAGGLAGGYHVFLERPLAAERENALGEVKALLRRLRARGHDEEALHRAFAGQGSREQRLLMSLLFGHEAVRAPSGRDAVLAWLEGRIQARHDRRHLRILQDAEEGRLVAQGINLLTARRKARRIAKAMMLERCRVARRDAAARGIGNSLITARACAMGTPSAGGRLARADPRAARGVPGAPPAEDRLAGQPRCSVEVFGSCSACAPGRAGFLARRSGHRHLAAGARPGGEIAATIGNAVTTADPGLLKEVKWNIPFDATRLDAPVVIEGLPEGPWAGYPRVEPRPRRAGPPGVDRLRTLADRIPGRARRRNRSLRRRQA